jgi:hypothetical protein
VDLTLAEPDDPEIEEVTPQNCYNSSDIAFEMLFTTAALSSASSPLPSPSLWPMVLIAIVTIATSLL